MSAVAATPAGIFSWHQFCYQTGEDQTEIEVLKTHLCSSMKYVSPLVLVAIVIASFLLGVCLTTLILSG